ncbi:hypothetical protein Lsan_3194 [Legionella santicrucis]|uniref:Uncharacterized protein n=1 Tax=Legionella santicrucis TaxID=45074 RepID=A0A0W0YFC5_9GAMM|nr:hypothetical protein [Legionella santicrucis]KTD55642.1 hypothetical protein Lsan_3194 [Legionella santicrucis]
MAKEVHAILSELDDKLSKKDNMASANMSFKERFQQLRAPAIELQKEEDGIASESLMGYKPN